MMYRYLSMGLRQRFAMQRLRRRPEMDMAMMDEFQVQEYSRDGEDGALAVLYAVIIQTVARIAPAQGSALDVASGSGQLLARLAQTMPNIEFLGTDISNHMLDIARRNAVQHGVHNVRLKNHSMYELDRLDGQFDLITFSLAMHHCETADDAVCVLRGLAGRLRPGGALLVFDIVRPKTGQIAVDFANYYNARQGSWYYQDSLDSYKAAFSFEEVGQILHQADLQHWRHWTPALGNFFQVMFVPAANRGHYVARKHLPRLWQHRDYWMMRMGFAGAFR